MITYRGIDRAVIIREGLCDSKDRHCNEDLRKDSVIRIMIKKMSYRINSISCYPFLSEFTQHHSLGGERITHLVDHLVGGT